MRAPRFGGCLWYPQKDGGGPPVENPIQFRGAEEARQLGRSKGRIITKNHRPEEEGCFKTYARKEPERE